MATTTVVIDPVTRIEGHLRIQATATAVMDTSGKLLYHEVQNPGLSASTMVRGIEPIMKDRDPRDAWAFAQRICGVCTVVHGLTSVRAVEQAIGLKVPKNAELIRNMMIGAQYVHDHVMHFYHLHALDWVDVVKALSANTTVTAALAAAANPNHKPNNGALPTAAYFQNVLDQLNGLKNRNQLGLFSNGYWGHPAYKLTAEQNLLLVSHYLEALAWAREVVKLHAIFGGRDPHPNLVVGGMPCTVSVGTEGGTALNSSGFTTVQNAITVMKTFVDNVYLPDTLLLAGVNAGAKSWFTSKKNTLPAPYPSLTKLPDYSEWAQYGASGPTRDANGAIGNFLCYGEFPNADTGIVASTSNDDLLIPHGVILGMTRGASSVSRQVFNVLNDSVSVTENVTHAWYAYSGTAENLHPKQGETTLKYDGPVPGTPANPGAADLYNLDQTRKYSWIKSPRWQANATDTPKAMEVGPLAHILMMVARNRLATDKQAGTLVNTYWTSPSTGLGLSLGKLNSTFGRIFCRTLETKIIADAMQGWHNALVANKNAAYFDPAAFTKLANRSTWTSDKVGVGFTEAPRGALGHWIGMSKSTGKVTHYQCIVASQWNAGPRDGNGTAGPYETSLHGQRLAVPEQPVEILRTIHSFDPCIGCAVHIVDPDGQPLVKVNVNHTFG
jgi:hydrogenase large subunit